MSWRLRLTLVLAALGVASALAIFAQWVRPRPPLPVMGPIPAFQLVDEHGAPFVVDSMLGHASIVDFIFTRCASSCPRLTARMGELQDVLARKRSAAQLVSFSVDPENDTPPVLLDYAAQAHADLSRWSFVTGPLPDLQRAVVDGFKVAVDKIARDAGDYDVIHGEWFVLVDSHARLRGYYSVQAQSDLDPLVADVLSLEARP
jgi:protein SCO1/2